MSDRIVRSDSRGRISLGLEKDRSYRVSKIETTGWILLEPVVFLTDAELAELADAGMDDAPNEERCPYTFAHTRHWCGNEGCRDS